MFGDKRRPPATIAAEIDRIIGLNIRRAREDVRLGQHEVATLLAISVHVLARYEEGQERAPASVLLELTRHLGCQLADLFAGMPTTDDDDFQGSRPSGPTVAETKPVPPAPAAFEPSPARSHFAGDRPAGSQDALAVANIIKAFAELKTPVLRERLLGLLQALA